MADPKPLIRLLPDVLLSGSASTWAALFAHLFRILAVQEGSGVDSIQRACGTFLN